MADPTSRLLQLLSLLQVRQEWQGDVLAGRLNVSPRTIRRDVDRLRELGYRIQSVSGPTGGYRLSNGSELPPLLFDDDQAVAVALALAVAPASGADIAEAAARALATVRQVMPSRLRARVDAIEVIPAPGRDFVDPEVLVAVSDATRKHEVLRFHYAPPGQSDDRPSRRVEPHAVIARAGRWYLLAWNDDAKGPVDGDATGDWRTYRMDRITLSAPTRRSFRPRPVPGGDPSSFVAARFRGSSSSNVWPCIGTAVVHLPIEQIAPYVDPDAVLGARDERSTEVTMGSWSWSALAVRFAGFDAQFELMAPAPLLHGAAELARRLEQARPARPDRPSGSLSTSATSGLR
ncbi:helix-turn-helix transcriptional regulator [Amnibacterium kyonggiense]|uniref:Putative DNA-binding transcriptional regulator YafY n=1 Tax=Amnibacterium kyonggiense TaxID=595671 RepID=A0A4R7FR63_9MICO|nr:WYL domain-containing protein [Amnibacterium kyonggiense]TDS80302.1 putative DNA-binding transcriptional regulator YafY [Amnibacterium kyonggiense]